MTPQQASHTAVKRAVKSGQLPAPTSLRCEACPDRASVWHHHHEGYLEANRLDVTALCGSCHALVHRGSIPEPRTGRTRTLEPGREGRGIWGPRKMVSQFIGRYARRAPPENAKRMERWLWAQAWAKANPRSESEDHDTYYSRVPATWAEVGL